MKARILTQKTGKPSRLTVVLDCDTDGVQKDQNNHTPICQLTFSQPPNCVAENKIQALTFNV